MHALKNFKSVVSVTLTLESDIIIARFMNCRLQSVTVSRCVTVVMTGCFALPEEACWKDVMEDANFSVKCVCTSSAKSDSPHACNSCRHIGRA